MTSRSDAERDVAAASALQAEMWPGALPAIPGFDCAAASLPAAGVGGDFYDVFAIDAGTWGILLGDVSGKGVAAGLVATALQGRVQTAARHARLAPASSGRGDQRRCVRVDAWAALCHAGLRRARSQRPAAASRQRRSRRHPARSRGFCGDGHRRGDGTGARPARGDRFRATDASAASQGPSSSSSPTASTKRSTADDVEFGTERVAALVKAMQDRTAAEQTAALLEAVRRHRGARQSQDDVTVMVVRAI